jgi:hypothetical protein
MKLQNKISILVLVLTSTIFGQKHAIELGANASEIQLSSELGYRLNVKHFTVNLHAAYGEFGKKKLKSPQYKDAYNGILNEFNFGYAGVVTDFTHSNKGIKAGVGLGYTAAIGEKHRFSVELNFDFYTVKDNYTYTWKTNVAPPIEGNIYQRDYKHNTVSAGLSVFDVYRLNNRFGLKFGLSLPFIVPTIDNNNFYLPQSKKLPMFGIEPYLTVGIQFSLTKKTKTDETPK